jgi:hypothetical protein
MNKRVFILFFLALAMAKIVYSFVFPLYYFWRDYEIPVQEAVRTASVDDASSNMLEAIHFLSLNGYTQGYSSWIIQIPDTDIGLWYKNQKAAKSILDAHKLGSEDAETTLWRFRQFILSPPLGIIIKFESGLLRILLFVVLYAIFLHNKNKATEDPTASDLVSLNLN